MLLQVDKDLLLTACVQRTISLGAGKTSQVAVTNKKQAINFRDTVARMVYDRLFVWIIEKASENLFEGASEHNDVFIGVLDIFGFEFYENHQIRAHNVQVVNGLDQLNINICNEMLQQQFVKVNIAFLLDTIIWCALAFFSPPLFCRLFSASK